MKILIFGGTGEARELANNLVALGHQVTTTLAGRTTNPVLPNGQVRHGGFGGARQLTEFIEQNGFDRVVDATHPYAQKMSNQVVLAMKPVSAPLLRLIRAEWQKPDGAIWVNVPDANMAMQQLPDICVPFLSLGHKEIGGISNWPNNKCVVRLIEPPVAPLHQNVDLILARPPYTLEDELALMRMHKITHLLTKNSGGSQTRAKIDAAALLNIKTFVVARPTLAEAREVSSVDAAIALLQKDCS